MFFNYLNSIINSGFYYLKCAEEQQRSRELDRLTEVLKLELEEERAKVAQGLREIRCAEAALFDAAHQLKGALKAANQGKLLKCAFDTLQKRFLLLGEVSSYEIKNFSLFLDHRSVNFQFFKSYMPIFNHQVQLKLQEQMVSPPPMARQEAAQIQRSYAEELSSE